MTANQFIFTGLALSIVGLLIHIWAANRKQKRHVTIAGTPVDLQTFLAHQAWDSTEHDRAFSRVDEIEQRLRSEDHRLQDKLDKLAERQAKLEANNFRLSSPCGP